MRILSLAALLLTVAACSSGSDRKLVIIHTNDEHSHILGFGPEKDDFPPAATAGSGAIHGGASRRATVFANLRSAAQGSGAASVTVSAGDNMMGTLVQIAATTASPDYRLMKVLGYDVTTLGNHEFDYGPAGLAAAVSVAKASAEGMPVAVSTNIHFSGTAADASLAALFDETGTDDARPIKRKYILTTTNGIKIGFIGIVGIDAAIKAPTKTPVVFSKAACCGEDNAAASLSQLYDDLQPTVTALRSVDKVDLVVLLSHGGVDPEHLNASEDHLIARNVAGIDVIVSGHSHIAYPAAVVKNDRTGRGVLIQQAGSFGQYVGKMSLTVKADGTVAFDLANSNLVPVDDTTVGGSAAIDTFVQGLVASLESAPVVPLSPALKISFLEYTLTEALGAPLTAYTHDNPATAGELYFMSFGKTAFDVPDNALRKESQAQVLAADAELWAADQATAGFGPAQGGPVNNLAVFAQGAVRAQINKGKTGDISFADVFRVVPLGGSPTTGTPGYPLCRFLLVGAEIKGAFDLVTANLAQQSVSNNDYFLVPSGMRVTYDMTRPAYNPAGDPLDPTNGRVTKMELLDSHAGGNYDGTYTTIYDVTHVTNGKPDPWFGSANALKGYVVITNLYVATLSYIGGVNLKNPANGAIYARPEDSILKRTDGTEIKDWEALAGYIKSPSGLNGTLPERYNAATAPAQRRSICVGAACN